MSSPRPVVLCVIRRDTEILVVEYDDIRDFTFYRPPGGGIEFGEHSRDAVIREMHEELGVIVTNLRRLGVVENIWHAGSERGHELIIVYEGAFAQDTLYDRQQFDVNEDDTLFLTAMWKPLDTFIDETAILFPTGLVDLLVRADSV